MFISFLLESFKWMKKNNLCFVILQSILKYEHFFKLFKVYNQIVAK